MMGTLSMQAMTGREALVAIYKAMNGPEWDADDAKGWNTNAPQVLSLETHQEIRYNSHINKAQLAAAGKLCLFIVSGLFRSVRVFREIWLIFNPIKRLNH